MAFYEVLRQQNLGEALQEPNRKMPVQRPERSGMRMQCGSERSGESRAERRYFSLEIISLIFFSRFPEELLMI